MAEHGNSNKNSKPHHLYEIRDSEDDDIFKYGISHYPIGEDGYSSRMRIQVDFLNVGVGSAFLPEYFFLIYPAGKQQNVLNVSILKNIVTNMAEIREGIKMIKRH